MTIALTKSSALEMLEQAVAVNGEDFRYADQFGEGIECQYAVPEGSAIIPGCIVGTGLAEMGVEPEQMRYALSAALPGLAGWEATQFPGSGWVPYMFATVPLTRTACSAPEFNLIDATATENATRVLWAAQVAQDNNHSWGEALVDARAVAALLDGE